MPFPITYITSENYSTFSTGLVPYTGATANVDLGAYSLKVGSGTVSSNSIQIGAANVGLFSASANRIDFVTNGISRMAILASGTVVMGSDSTNIIGNTYLDFSTNTTGIRFTPTSLSLSVASVNCFNIIGASTTGNTTSFNITKPNNTGQTATFSISGWNFNGGTRQWNTGNIGTQSENVWGGVTYSFVGASTIDTAYGNVFNQATAGTNATITNNYSAHFTGNIFMSGGNRVIRGSNGLTLEGAGGGPTTVRAGASGTVCLGILGETNGLVYSGYFSSGAVTNFNFNKASSIGQTASTAIAGWSYTGNSRTWLTGNITAQNENIWGAVTYNFGGASVITKAIGNVFNAPVAGTNCTITANFAAQFNGNVEINGSISNSGGLPNLGAAATPYGTFFITNIRGATDLTLGSGYSTSGDRGLIMFASTRNIVIQNGGTFVDNGYRLDVQGTTRITGNTTIGSTGQLFQFSTSANNPSYTQTGATGSSIYTVSGGLQVKMQSFAGAQNWLFATGGRFLFGTSDAQPLEFYTNTVKRFSISAIGIVDFFTGSNYADSTNIAFGTTTGSKIGATTTQKIAFWNATPIVQPANTVSLNGVLENTGLMASGSTISTINKPLVAGVNTTPRTGVATDGVTSVLGDLKTWGDNYFSGEVLYDEVSGEALSFGQLCYRDRFGNWLKAVANVASETSYNMLGICLRTTAEQGTPISILTKGYVQTTYIVGGNTGDPLYISEATAGSITNITPTSAGNVVRLVGNVFWDSTSQTNGKWILSFSPDNTWIEL
jgi:hypothetical protein